MSLFVAFEDCVSRKFTVVSPGCCCSLLLDAGSILQGAFFGCGDGVAYFSKS